MSIAVSSSGSSTSKPPGQTREVAGRSLVRSTARARRVRAGESALMESLGTLAPDQVRTRACSRLLDGARPWIPDGGRWCKSDIGADGGGERKSPGSVSIAGAEADASRWMGRGDEGERDPIQLVCFDKPQVARRFPHKPETRPRRSTLLLLARVGSDTRAASVGRLSRPADALVTARPSESSRRRRALELF
jgi:hypothetical protein